MRKYVVGIAIILCVGILIGVFIGMSVADKDSAPAVENEAETVTNGQIPVLTPTGNSEKEDSADGQIPTLTPTVSPKTEDSSDGQIPTLTPTLTATPTVSPKPEDSADGQIPTLTPTDYPKIEDSADEKIPTLTPTDYPKTDDSADEKTPTLTSTPTPTLTPAPTPTVSPKPEDVTDEYTDKDSAGADGGYFGRLHVEGNHLADEDNNPVQLRGISTHGIGWFPQYVNKEAIHQFNSEWGCNVFRLAMYTAEGAGYCTNGDSKKAELKELVHKGVSAAIDEDMYVIIDWHVLQDQDPNRYKDEAKKFFGEMAEKYGNDPHVIYEICNEPNGGTSWSMIKQYALEVIPVIREFAPDAIIIVGTPTWSQDVDIAAKDPITEYDNIMYALHFYASTHTDSLRNKCKTAAAAGLPIFVSEYGICEASGSGYINVNQADKWMELLDSLCISHVAWNLSNKNESSAMIAAGCDKVSGFAEKDLSEGGKWFVNMLGNTGAGADLPGETEDAAGSADSPEDTEDAAGNADSPEKTEDAAGSADSPEDTAGKQDNADSPIEDKTGQVNPGTLEDLITAGTDISITVVNSWDTGSSTGIQLSLTVKNTSGQDISDWKRILTIKDGVSVELSQFWNCSAGVEGNTITVTPAEYNKNIGAGKEVGDIGMILNVTKSM